MHLEQLEINGFKSFRDKTVVSFSPGITALVGRNGHGKSNLVDAIRWALGAGSRATKDLRIKKQQDIIFAGTYNDKGECISPPKDVAEVAVTFSNEDHSMKVDAPTVEIRRSVDRNGNSEYYINRNRVKAEDIRSLLYDTGIGKAGYSILEQGKIAKLLSDKPEERRSVFDEAAGISRYKKEMEEASKNISDTDANIKLVEIDYNRLKRDTERLRIQKDNLVTYKKLKTQSFEFAVKSRLIDLREAEKSKNSIEEKIKKDTATLEGLKEKLKKWQGENENRSSAISELYKEKNEMLVQSGAIEKDIALLSQRFETLNLNLDGMKRHLEDLNVVFTDRKSREKETKDLLKGENSKKEELQKEQKKLVASLEKLNKSIEALQADAEKLEKDAADKDLYLKEMRESLEEKIATVIASLYEILGKIKNGDTALTSDAEKLLKTLEGYIAEYKKAQTVFVDEMLNKRRSELQEKRSKALEELDSANKALSELNLSIVRLDDSINSLTSAYNAMEEELKKADEEIKALKKSMEELNASIKAVKDEGSEKQKELQKSQKLQNEIDAKIQKLTNLDDSQITAYTARINELTVQNANLQGRLEALDESIKKIHTEFFDEYGRSINEMQKEIALKETDTKDFVRSSLSKIMARMKECGNINEYAEDEWKDKNEQYTLVKNQLEDLQKAKADSKQVYDEICVRSCEQFLQTFEKIQESFDDTFKVMFGGGNASLELQYPEGEEADPLTCGVDIKVQPPGKTMRLLGLSGGEADKVAAVLLFAIYRVKSTPFCILDEIDHAWDSHNISAFLEMLRHFTDKIQFLIVTHSTQTARGVDRLLAITQEEDGISKTFDYTYNKDAVDRVLKSEGKGIRLKG